MFNVVYRGYCFAAVNGGTLNFTKTANGLEIADGFYSLQRFLHLLVLGAEADADIALAVVAEDEARRDEDMSLVQDSLGEVFHIFIFIREYGPKGTYRPAWDRKCNRVPS
jgi:hypothetical protein